MKRLFATLIVLVGIVVGSCNEPAPPLEDYYRFKSIKAFELAEPKYRELVIGETVNLRELLSVRDAGSSSVEVPEEVLGFYANDQRLTTSVFTATVAGTYALSAGIGNRRTNLQSVTVLPPGAFPLIKIPVVFHAVGVSLSQTQVTNLLNGLSVSFRNRWRVGSEPKDANSADCFVEFYAAEKDPKGNALPIKGLNKVNPARTEFTSEQATLEAWNSFWEPTRYLNIWVFTITGDYKNASWAYLPSVTRTLAGLDLRAVGTAPLRPQGVFLNAKHLNYVPLLAHEVGHALGLHHVFDGNLDIFKGCTLNDPDYCEDTPYYDRNNYEDNIDTYQQNRTACNGHAYVSTNFMDYDYSYENSFTRDQRVRVRHVLNYGLWLPTRFNGATNGREGTGYVHKPDDYYYTPPVVCFGHLKSQKNASKNY